MTTAQQQELQAQRRTAIIALAGNTEFRHFMDAIKGQLDVAIKDSLNDAVLDSERLSLVAKGECRAYLSIIAEYEEAVEAHRAASEQSMEAKASDQDP